MADEKTTPPGEAVDTLEFTPQRPKGTRSTGDGEHKYMKNAHVEKFEANPGQWATVAKGVGSAQSIAQWVHRKNGSPDGKAKDGAWEYKAVANGSTTNKKDETVPLYDVSVCYNPDGIKWK